jgi:threonine/homoserine/homoserine lactone efflux protein
VNPDQLLAFWGVTLLLIVVPGPDWAFVLASGARDHTVLPAVSGLMLGYSLFTVLVAAGVGAIVGQSPLFLTVLAAVGASYLIYLCVSLLRHPGSLHTDSSPGSSRTSTNSHVRRGIGVSGLNPKGLLIFVAMLPQFTDSRGTWPLPLQLAILGLVFVGTCGAFYTIVGYSARAILTAKPAASSLITRASGAAMIIVGLVLLIERLVAKR